MRYTIKKPNAGELSWQELHDRFYSKRVIVARVSNSSSRHISFLRRNEEVGNTGVSFDDSYFYWGDLCGNAHTATKGWAKFVERHENDTASILAFDTWEEFAAFVKESGLRVSAA